MKKLTFLTLLFLIVSALYAQEKKPLDHSVYTKWKTIENTLISDDGRYVVYQVNFLKGDGYMVVSDRQKKTNDTLFRAVEPAFLPGGHYLVARIKPEEEKVLALKRDKKKGDDLPADSLLVYGLANRSRTLFPDIESYALAKEESSWLLIKKRYLASNGEKEDEDEEAAEVLEGESGLKEEVPGANEEEEKANKELEKKFNKLAKKYKAADLVIANPELAKSYVYENVLSFKLSRNGKLAAFTQLKRDSIAGYVAYAWLGSEQQLLIVGEGAGVPAQLGVDDPGKQLAYAVTADSARVAGLGLYCWTPGTDTASLLIGESNNGLLPGWGLSRNGELFFSEDGSKLYFGAAPILPEQEKDTLLKEEKYSLDIWNWKDPVLQPEQLKEAAKDRKRTWLSVIKPGTHTAVQLADSTVARVSLLHRNNGRYLLGIDEDKYARLMNWEGVRYSDVYVIDNETGERFLAAEKLAFSARLSAFGNYLYWFQPMDSSWYVYDIKSRATRNISGPVGLPFYDEDNDMPEVPGPYGQAGWTTDDRYILVYDRYDIWKLDPAGKEAPQNMTNGEGRKNKLRYRYEQADPESWYIDLEQPVYLTEFNMEDMSSGFSVLYPATKNNLQSLIRGPWRYSVLRKAKNADRFTWRKQDFRHYPDMWYGTAKLEKGSCISSVNPQQDDYLWGDAQLVSWVSYAGDSLKGILYTPENLDSRKKYPMLVYFYERSADGLYRYSVPSPSRSIISPSWCVSNGYIVFIPDIVYREGYPGQSAYDAVVSGTEAMLAQFPFIDKEHMGLQGQSWGGYQTAYLVTKTDMYAAAMAGAPVSNMTSAYGGIRWGTGLSRMFQYEHSQSRIGGTLWDKTDLYLENSPVFFAPDVHTPLLMMHNDNDGAVPWYQGIEYFVALRRLDKPVWMLVYNGEEHNLTRWPNRVDLSIRMMQFFDYYLKGAPEPDWMRVGIPAVKKGETDGYGFGEAGESMPD